MNYIPKGIHEWQSMCDTRPQFSSKVEFKFPDGHTTVGEFFCDMAGWYIYTTRWCSLDEFTHWRYI